MSDALRELYQEVILDHGRSPRNCRRGNAASHCAHGDNPFCGDAVDVYLTVDDKGVIRDAAFEGRGCAISVASASLMTEVLKGKTRDRARELFQGMQRMCTGRAAEAPADDEADAEDMERLQVLSGVKEFPLRVKCATLAWHTMAAALAGEGKVSVE